MHILVNFTLSKINFNCWMFTLRPNQYGQKFQKIRFCLCFHFGHFVRQRACMNMRWQVVSGLYEYQMTGCVSAYVCTNQGAQFLAIFNCRYITLPSSKIWCWRCGCYNAVVSALKRLYFSVTQSDSWKMKATECMFVNGFESCKGGNILSRIRKDKTL